MDTILGPIQDVVPSLQHVSIREDAIPSFVETIDPTSLPETEFNAATILASHNPDDHIAFACIYDCLTFSFWGSPKWTVTIDGVQLDGCYALIRALKKGIESGLLSLDAAQLARIPADRLQKVLNGTPQIPLFAERLRFLNQLGGHIEKHYNKSFAEFVDQAQWDAEKLTIKLATELPDIFDDTHIYEGTRIHFYKRAQLVPAHLCDLHKFNCIPQRITNVAALTAFADYKVPQLMRSCGILEYSPELAAKVDNLVELQPGSTMELEIRIATVWANELCTRYARKRMPDITAAQMDELFWCAGQGTNATIKPYHRTRTVWY